MLLDGVCKDSSGQHRQGGGQRLTCPSAYVILMLLHTIIWDIKSKHLFLKYLKNGAKQRIEKQDSVV